MKNIFVILLVCVSFSCSHALEHNLFYGNCVHDDQTIQLYSQVIMMNNSNTIQNSKPRKWYDWFSFNRKPTPSPRFSRKVINATIQFPPAVSRFHLNLLTKLIFFFNLKFFVHFFQLIRRFFGN